MDIRILGAVEVWDAGVPVRLVRRQQRMLLGILALEPNRTVTTERLIDLLWGTSPPPNARAIVHTWISELRTALHRRRSGTVEIVSLGFEYELRLLPDLVDAQRFLNLVARAGGTGPAEEARATLRRALSLWRGPVLGGQSPVIRADHLCRALDAARLAASEDLFDLELGLGHHQQVADEIYDLALANPSRERLVGQTMLALHRCGRTAEALHYYDRWRRWLRDELGIDPGADLQQLHIGLLQGDSRFTTGPRPSVHTPDAESTPTSPPPDAAISTPEQPHEFTPAVPRILPPDIGDFTGRGTEVSLIQQLLTQEPRVQSAVVVISGRAGVGKTTLCVHVANKLRDTFPDGQLHTNLHGFDRENTLSPFEALGRFLRLLGVDSAGVPQSLDERADLYRQLLTDRRILVVLDNAANDEQLLPLIPTGAGCAVLITSRIRLGAAYSAHAVGLDVLGADDAALLVARIAGADRIADEPAEVAELCRYCENLPLALRVAAAKLSTKQHWSMKRLANLLRNEHTRLNQLELGHLNVRASIALSYNDLEPDLRCLFRRLASIDLPEFDVATSAALLDRDHATAEQLMEQLFDAQLVDVAGNDEAGFSRYRMHDLVRIFGKEQKSAEDTIADIAAAHTRASGWLLHAAESAYRSVFGGLYENITGQATRWSVDQRILDALIANPLQWFENERLAIQSVIRQAAQNGNNDLCWELASTASPFFQMRRYFAEWHEVLDIALTAAHAANSSRGQGVIHFRLGLVHADETKHDEARQHFLRAKEIFQSIGDRHGEAIVLPYLGMIARFQGDNDRSLSLYTSAVPTLRDVEDRGGLAYALRAIAQIYTERGAYDVADSHFEEALALYRSSSCRPGQAQVLFWRSMLRLRQGRTIEASAGFEDALEICRLIGDRAGEAQCLRGVGLSYLHRGDHGQARAFLMQALRLVRQPHQTLTEQVLREDLAKLPAT